jgi:hypothetical protein
MRGSNSHFGALPWKFTAEKKSTPRHFGRCSGEKKRIIISVLCRGRAVIAMALCRGASPYKSTAEKQSPPRCSAAVERSSLITARTHFAKSLLRCVRAVAAQVLCHGGAVIADFHMYSYSQSRCSVATEQSSLIFACTHIRKVGALPRWSDHRHGALPCENGHR